MMDDIQKPSMPEMPFDRIPKFHVDLPVGAVIAYAGDIAPPDTKDNEYVCCIEALGMMECDGRELLINQYPELFAVLGYKFGGQEGKFNLPNYKGLAPIKGSTYVIKFTYINEM